MANSKAHSLSGNSVKKKVGNHLTDSKRKLKSLALPKDDPMQSLYFNDLAKQELGWETKVKMEEDLKKTISSFDGII